MRPKRAIVSVLLFSAAPLASSGCVDDPDPPPEVGSVDLGAEMEIHAAPDMDVGATPDVDVDAPPDLLTLRTELLATKPEASLAAIDHFRPLCDADGYPLVGNVANKVQAPGLQPSQFCAEVRARI